MWHLPRFYKSAWLTACGSLFFLTVVELAKPAAFFWDDNANEFLPWYAFNYYSVAHGALPQIDFYNYLGSPLLYSGQPATFYPPIYLAMALARVLGRPEIAIEWLAWVHLAGAAVVMERLVRFFGSPPLQSMAAAWLYGTLPFLVCSTESWIYNSYAAFYIPLIFLGLEKLARQITFQGVAVLALVKTLLFISGAINYFALTILFEAFYLLVRPLWGNSPESGAPLAFTQKLTAVMRSGMAWVAATFLMVLLALPSLGPMILHLGETAERSRPMPLSVALGEDMHPRTFLCSQVGIFINDASDSYAYRPGWLFLGGSVLLPILLLSAWRNAEVRRWSLMALLALTLSTTAFIVIHELPGYGAFRWPAKNMLFAAFFYVLAFSAGVRVLPSRWPEKTRLGIFLFGVIMNLIVASGPESRIGSEYFPRFAPEFHLPLDRLQNGRTVLVGERKVNVFNPDYLGCEFAAMARVPALAGYDPMVLEQNKREALGIVFIGLPWSPLDDAMAQHLRSWSVRYYFADDNSPSVAYLQDHPRFTLMFQSGSLRIFEDQQARPLAYFEDDPQKSLPLVFGNNEVTVDTSGHPGGGTLSVALVPVAGYSWGEKGEEGRPVPVVTEGRMRIPDVPGGESICILYREPHLNLFLALSLGTFAALAYGLILRLPPTRRGAPGGKYFRRN